MGTAFIAGGIFFVRRGWRDGIFYGQGGVRYHESRTDGPIGFWCNLGFNALLIPADIWLICWGASGISD
ncbi:MAG TPA: hypothetical protein VGL95_02345 [Acetobacteraceae bacterium]|jgi:hypothetical protein